MILSTSLFYPCYHDDEAARITFEAVRWPGGPTARIAAALTQLLRSAASRWGRVGTGAISAAKSLQFASVLS